MLQSWYLGPFTELVQFTGPARTDPYFGQVSFLPAPWVGPARERSAEGQSPPSWAREGALCPSAGRAAARGGFGLVGVTALACDTQQRCNEDESLCFWTAHAGPTKTSWHQQSGEIQPHMNSKCLKDVCMAKHTFGWLFYGCGHVRCPLPAMLSPSWVPHTCDMVERATVAR